MGNNSWVVENLNNALATWNGKLQEIWQLLLTSPEEFRGGSIWSIILHICLNFLQISLRLRRQVQHIHVQF